MSLYDQLNVGQIKSRVINNRVVRYLAQGSGWRYDTLLEKEPETIEWIDCFDQHEIFWDIGANVGIYSIYAATRGIKVVAFEPHFANYFQLCMNIMLNNLQDKILPLCMAFTKEKAVNTINLASVDFGTSMSSFGSNLDFRGKAYDPAFRQGMIGYDIDSFIRDFNHPIPNHIKIDVDGIELDIIQGGQQTFSNHHVKSVSVELIDSDSAQVNGVSDVLKSANLHFVQKRQNAAFATPETKDVLNFLYTR